MQFIYHNKAILVTTKYFDVVQGPLKLDDKAKRSIYSFPSALIK